MLDHPSLTGFRMRGRDIINPGLDKPPVTSTGVQRPVKTVKSFQIRIEVRLRDFDTRSQCSNGSPMLTSSRKLFQELNLASVQPNKAV